MLIGLAGFIDAAKELLTGTMLLALGVMLALAVLVYSSVTTAVFTLAVYRYGQGSTMQGPFAEGDLISPFVGERRAQGEFAADVANRD